MDKVPWCVMPLRHFRQVFSIPRRLQYIIWRLCKLGIPLVTRLSDGTWITIRPRPASDLAVAYEIMFDRAYELPDDMPPNSVQRVIDLGANVGYSCLWWASLCPNAKIEAFEPHPAHADLLRWHTARNGLHNRITLHVAAAGAHHGATCLTDEGANSKLAPGGAASLQTFDVAVVDFFEVVGESPIDILKIDIEGGEYAILSDPRFAQIRARLIILEYHGRFEETSGDIWCQNRLTELGYKMCTDPRPGQILRARLA